MIVKNQRIWPWLVTLGAWVIVVLVVLPPFVEAGPRAFLMHAFSFVCHQLPGRSPHVDGVSLAVCDRCTGLYVGVAAGTLAGLGLGGPRRFLYNHAGPAVLAALVPVGSDWTLDIFGLWSNTPMTRAGTGAAFGLIMGALLVAAAWPRPNDDPGGS